MSNASPVDKPCESLNPLLYPETRLQKTQKSVLTEKPAFPQLFTDPDPIPIPIRQSVPLFHRLPRSSTAFPPSPPPSSTPEKTALGPDIPVFHRLMKKDDEKPNELQVTTTYSTAPRSCSLRQSPPNPRNSPKFTQPSPSSGTPCHHWQTPIASHHPVPRRSSPHPHAAKPFPTFPNSLRRDPPPSPSAACRQRTHRQRTRHHHPTRPAPNLEPPQDPSRRRPPRRAPRRTLALLPPRPGTPPRTSRFPLE